MSETGAPPIARAEAERIVGRALAAAAAADHATAILSASDAALTRFANNEIHQSVAARDVQITLEVVCGSRRGAARGNDLDDAGLHRLAERALALARLAPVDDDLPEPAPPTTVPAGLPASAATAACTPEERARAVAPVLAAADRRGLTAAGALSTAATVLAVGNSRGHFAAHAGSHARFTCTALGGDASGWVDRHRRDWRELDIEDLGRRAIDKAERSAAPTRLAPGRYTAILEPAAVAELVAFLGWLGLGARSEQEGRSFLSGRLGERVTGEAITLVDDAADPRSFGCPFDHEGTPRQRVELVRHGVGCAVVHDRRTAARAGVTSTGHASAPPAPEGPLPADLVLAGGDSSLERMIAETESGVLVTRFWYNRVVDARRTLVTGMTRDGTFHIVGGRLAGGLRNLRFNDSVLDLLARADRIGAEAEPTVFDFGGGCVVAPALRVPDFHFTGVTEF